MSFSPDLQDTYDIVKFTLSKSNSTKLKSYPTARPNTKSGFLKPKSNTLSTLPKSQNAPQADKESSYQETINLKASNTKLLLEVTKLKSRVKMLDKNSIKAEQLELHENYISHQKKIINDLSKKIIDLEEENNFFKKSFKLTRNAELEAEISAYREECNRLKHQLQESYKRFLTTHQSGYLEKELGEKQSLINAMKKSQSDLQIEIEKLKEEISSLKEANKKQVSSYRNTKKKQTVLVLCDKCQETQRELKNKTKDMEDLQASFQKNIDYEKFKQQELENSLAEANKNCSKLAENIEVLNKQLAEAKSSFSISYVEKSSPVEVKKTKEAPPKLFSRINKIVKAKYMFPSVYLSILDKRNTGIINEEDLKKGTIFNGKPLLDTDIKEALFLMNCSRQVSVRVLEDWYEKFDYEIDSEQVPLAKISKAVQIDDLVLRQSLLKKSTFQDISFMFEQIKMLMLERNIPRNKTLLNLFKDKLDSDSMVSAESFGNSLVPFFTEINSTENIRNFSLFLVTSGANSSLSFSEISNRLNHHLPEWNIIDRYKSYYESHLILLENKNELVKIFENQKEHFDGFLPIDLFNSILLSFGSISTDSFIYLYLISFEKTKQVNKIKFRTVFNEVEETQGYISYMKRTYKPFLSKLKVLMRDSLATLSNPVGLDFGIPVEQFTGSIEALNLTIPEQFIKEFTKGLPRCDLSLLKILLSEDLNESCESEFGLQINIDI